MLLRVEFFNRIEGRVRNRNSNSNFRYSTLLWLKKYLNMNGRLLFKCDTSTGTDLKGLKLNFRSNLIAYSNDMFTPNLQQKKKTRYHHLKGLTNQF